MTKTLRELAQDREDKILDHPLATPSSTSRGRERKESEDPIRLCFQRDAHRILHCTAFRRLRYKTQVIFSPESDHVSTRVDHSLYMASIAQTVARALGLNQDLAYAIALGHDLGHGPFGHAGETVLDKLWKRNDSSQSFSHELHSLRVVDQLAFRPSTEERGLNLTYEVRDGIVCHCGESTEQTLTPRAKPGPALGKIRRRGVVPLTMEGCVVRLADRIAYSGRDYEDALSVFGKMPSLPKAVIKVLGEDNRTIINNLVTDMIRTNLKTPDQIGFSDDVFEAFRQLYAYNCKNIYFHPLLNEYAIRAENMLTTIFDFEQRELSSRRQNQWGVVLDKDPLAVREVHHFIEKMYGKRDRPSLSQIVIDHMSLMTDRYARNFFQEIFLPKPVG
ncbi:MAG: HD domain-containing protein [bacterium]